MQGTKSLKEYLKRYQSNNEEEHKKKRKKKKVKSAAPGVLVVDEEPVWQKPVKLEEEEDNDSADEEKPQIDEDIEVKRMKRLEQLRSRRPYNAIAEDGSGWISLSPKRANDDQNSDISPPRRQRIRNDTLSPEPEGKLQAQPLDAGVEDADLSPPGQQRRRYHTPSPEPHLSSDLSPPRKQKDLSSDLSSPRKQKDLNSDLSPPRKKRDLNSNLSPPRKKRDLNSDLSPPRKQMARNDTPSPDQSLKSSREAAGMSPDLSPPRKSRVGKSGSLDLSPERFPKCSSSTVNAHSRASLDEDISLSRKNQESSIPASSKERPKTGLITGRDIEKEISKTKKNELLRFEKMDPSVSGRGAQAVYRDKKGQRISKEEYMKSKQKVEEKPKEIKLEWGKGLAQKREAEARLQELELEKDKPFARTRDDPELDKMLKERVRWGDPMAHLIKKKHSEPVLADFGDSEKMKESGFIVPQEIPYHSWIKRGLDAAPNRYGIKPGRHWDGVDRSNGFEKKMFQRMNEKRATEREAYLWSVSDM